MALFKDLHALLRKGQSSMYEDLLTEVFADVMRDKEVLMSYIQQFLGINLVDPQGIIITTQKSLLRIEDHETDSRPDLVVQFREQGKKYILFFENKIHSEEGHTQLERYADHLRSYRDDGYLTFLIYTTRYDDMKDTDKIFSKGKSAKFIQLRWYKIYDWLKDHKDPYVNRVLEFMEEIGLKESRRFLPQDMYALQEMNRLQHMMDECLDGAVDEVMTKLFRKATGWSNRGVQLRDHFRYYKMNDQSNGTWVGCGFHLTEDEYPEVCVQYEVSPTSKQRKEVIKAMTQFLEDNPEWEDYDLDDDSRWSGISCDRPLLAFLKEEDHIKSIQEYFIEKLKELYLLKQHNSQLGWKR